MSKLIFNRPPYDTHDWTLLYLKNGAAAVYAHVRYGGKDNELVDGLSGGITDMMKTCGIIGSRNVEYDIR